MSNNNTNKSLDKSACNEEIMNSETDTPECKSSEKVDILSAATATDSEEDDAPVVRSNKRLHRFSDSDEDSDDKSQHKNQNMDLFPMDTEANLPQECPSNLLGDLNAQNTDDDGNMNISLHMSRLRKVSRSSDSSDSKDAKSEEHTKSPAKSYDVQDSRINNKRSKLKEKFKSLVTKRLKGNMSGSDSETNSPADHSNSDADASPNSEDEASSIIKTRLKLKKKAMQINSSICDPDTSDEEVSMAQARCKPKIKRKSVKPTSPKPIRMSAKQAMENMQKIKSESNRMLREKEVSLPYHRPKALSLKDILSKRRPAVSADGKVLPIKMNAEQLRQYAQQLEQRQKEVIELCKSESEDETNEPKECEDILETEKYQEDTNQNNQEIETINDTIYDEMSKTETSLDTKLEDETSDDPRKIENSIDSEKMDVDEASSNIEPLQTNKNKHQEGNIKPTSIDLDKHMTSLTETKAFNDNDKINSSEIELVYNDSVEETSVANIERSESTFKNLDSANEIAKPNTEADSQFISLQYDNTEKTEYYSENLDQVDNIEKKTVEQESHDTCGNIVNKELSQDEILSDDCINMDVIDALIENAEISANQKMTNDVNSPMLIKEPDLTAKPKLTGAPGMVIDLDGTDPLVPKKLTGVELLKERFVFFAKLKTPEELERDKEKTLKPGVLHFELKQELEEQIAEQRSLEWAKRLKDEKQHKEQDSVGSDVEDIDDIEAKLEEKEEDDEKEASSSESEEEVIEHDVVNKPRKRNPMVDDEAEESDCDDIPDDEEDGEAKDEDEGNEADEEGTNKEDETEESSDESEEEQEHRPKKGRILKAFEDSDDEDSPKIVHNEPATIEKTDTPNNTPKLQSKALKESQDDVLQLAQKSQSEDLFTSQDSKTTNKVDIANTQEDSCFEDKDLGTQTFSILETSVKENVDINLSIPDNLPMTCDSQAFDDNLDAVVGMCSGSFSQNLVPPSQMTDVPPSQVIGENVLALCTGQFYDNQLVSQDDNDNREGLQTDKAETLTFDLEMNPTDAGDGNSEAMSSARNINELNPTEKLDSNVVVESIKKSVVDSNLKSILDELNDPEFHLPKPNKYFVSNMKGNENKSSVANAQFRKFVIGSDDDEGTEEAVSSKKIKKKKKKMEQRALQISDDEEEEEEFEEDNEFESDVDDVVEEDEERIVQYDSDENEVIVQLQNPKKKRKLGEFFENEAELTSEDEWIGSGDEDEAGLDRMEREEGDDETFNQNQLQRELGQIHMRDVLDQDKREVRLIQELLFEDGDLGGGSRQRKFRWKDVDGEDDTGTGVDEFADTQEDEAESEEQWRKQRHERETFLRSLNKQEDTPETLHISFNKTSTIMANLSKDSSNVFVEENTSIEKTESPAPEKKTAKDIPSPKKPFGIFQQNYHGSLLTRGRGALARLAALATPLVTDDDAPKVGSLAPTNKSNFVFAALDSTKKEHEPKAIKRKAEANVGTPRLVKKLRTEDKQKHPRTSLLHHLKI